MRKIMLVFGTRPEAIKMCPLIIELKRHQREFKTVVCTTAQHREMLDQVLNIFDVVPDFDLNLMTEDQTLFDITFRALNGLGTLIQQESPDLVFVQGDTTSTFAASLAAYYNRVPIGHVEAGLRTGDKFSPFPEEINRKLTGHIADLHFAPTKTNRDNLVKEGIPPENIVVTGNTVIDALLWVRGKIGSNGERYRELNCIDFTRRVILVTGHRRENFGTGLMNICNALREIAQNYEDIELVYPVHFNPNVRRVVSNSLSGIGNIKLIDPLNYAPFVHLMDNCYFIISDSGGIQEEAPSLGKPVLVTRNTTERPEAIEVGAAKLVGTNKDKIISEAERLLTDHNYYENIAHVTNPYGDGKASQRIAKRLLQIYRTDDNVRMSFR